MQRLLEREFQQGLAEHAPVVRFVDPEFTTLAGMFRYSLAILAGDRNLD